MYYICSENKDAVTAQLICAFVFAYANTFSHDTAHFVLNAFLAFLSAAIGSKYYAPRLSYYLLNHNVLDIYCLKNLF